MRYIIVIIIAYILCSCSSSKTEINNNDESSSEVIVEGNKITIGEKSSILPTLSYQTTNLEPFSIEFRTVGTIQAETGRYAEVGVPFDGRITKVCVKLGSWVEAGDTLFEMTSPEYLDACKVYFQSIRNYDKTKAEYERQKELAAHGVTSKKDLDEAYTESENARQDMEYSKATLRTFGTDPEHVKVGGAMNIISPVSGEVAFSNVVVGAYTKSDVSPLVKIADLRKVWVTALVKERFIGAVTTGGTAEIMTESEPNNPIKGKIIHVGNIVDEQTRSVQVVISCDNEGLKLKHGMYVSVHILSEKNNVIVLPSTAIFQGDNGSYVFVCTDHNNIFERRNVILGGSNDDNSKCSIQSGLVPGERVVVEGGVYLNN